MTDIPNSLSFSDLADYQRQNQFRRDVLNAVEEDALATTHLLINRIIDLETLYKEQILNFDNVTQYQVTYPNRPIDVFHETITNYLSSLEVQEQVIWNDKTAAEMVVELNNNSKLAGEFISELLNFVFSQENWQAMQAEEYDPQKHGLMTDFALQIDRVYMLIKTLKYQLDRVAMKSHTSFGRVEESYLLNNQELLKLVEALAIKFGFV